MASPPRIGVVRLNVGGCTFQTRITTLVESNTFFSGILRANEVEDGSEVFVDRDPTYFRFVLNWIRGVRYLPTDDGVLSELLFEADYYCMHDMVEAIRSTIGLHPPVNRTLYEISRHVGS